jgi:hypothetical protein
MVEKKEMTRVPDNLQSKLPADLKSDLPDDTEEKLKEAVWGEIIAQSGDLPFPLAVTGFPIQTEWSRILTQNRESLIRKARTRLQTAQNSLESITEKNIHEMGYEIVKEALVILQKVSKGLLENGNDEFRDWLNK